MSANSTSNTSPHRAQNVLDFYLLTATLKDKIRQGLINWNIKRDRLESIAEHVYGVCVFAIAMDSEYDFGVDFDLGKVLQMLIIHELEEIIIGDIAPYEKISPEEKRQKGQAAVTIILQNLNKKAHYQALIEEFNERQTPEAVFAHLCDKLEHIIQIKIYENEGCCDLNSVKNPNILQDTKIQTIITNGAQTIAQIFADYDREQFQDTQFEEVFNQLQNTHLQQNSRQNGNI